MKNSADHSMDEVDVSSVIGNLSSGINRLLYLIFKRLAALRNLIISRRRVFLISCLLGISASLVYLKFYDRPAYRSEFLLKSSFLNFEILGNFVENLNSLCEERERLAMAKTLNISIELAKSIKKIEVEEFYSERELLNGEMLKQQLMNELSSLRGKQKDIEPDEVHEKNMKDVIKKLGKVFQQTFKISVSVYGDPTNIRLVQRAIEDYLLTVGFIKRRFEAGVNSHLKEKEYLKMEMRKLDSIKIAFVDRLKSSPTASSGLEKSGFVVGDRYILDPMQVYILGNEYHERIIALDEETAIGTDFEIVNDAIEVHHRDNLEYYEVLILAILSSFVLGILFVWIKEVDSFLSNLHD
ncbi:MAG: hypothetical protein FJZ78_01230 [Bacteroidetes bacterium]|nr:hypothetical protein [Bacteroidota bacterium]